MALPAEQPPDVGDSFAPYEVGSVLESVSLLDQLRQGYFDLCGEYTKTPRPQNEEYVRQAAVGHSKAFEHMLRVLEPETPTIDFIHQSIELLRQQDSERVDALNSLLRTSTLAKLNVNLDGLDEGLADMPDATSHQHVRRMVLSQTVGMFNAGLTADTMVLVTEVQNTKAARKAHIQQEIGKHTVNVLKFALGVAGVVLIVRNPKQ